MSGPAANRVPVEIWERILLNVISADSLFAFAASCSASDYLLFKRACSDDRNDAFQHSYLRLEKYRHRMRLVCRAWKDFADRWDLRARWIRLPLTHSRGGWNDEMWRGVLRVDVDHYSGASLSVLGSVLSTWKKMGHREGRTMQLTKLEILRVEVPACNEIFRDLCDAAPYLKNLRSLGLVVLDEKYTILEKLAIHFPELTHLTLCLNHIAHRSRPDDPKPERAGSPRLTKLEVLLLFPARHWNIGESRIFDMKQWVLPSLRHFHIRRVDAFLNQTYAFLGRHAATIETIDLDPGYQSTSMVYRGMEPKSVVLPLDFWDTFANLKVLRYSWDETSFMSLPKLHHSIECIILTDSVEAGQQLTDILRTWVRDEDSKVLGSIVVYGTYLSCRRHVEGVGEVKDLLQQAQRNGTRLVNPDGKPWPMQK